MFSSNHEDSSTIRALERIHLTILMEVADRGSLTAAARALGLTQSALSHSIKKLEQDLHTRLWRREGRALQLTPAGEHLLGVARRLLPQLAHAEQVVAEYARGQRGHLRIGMECHPCYQWLLKVISPYLRAFPDVDLDVKQKFQFGGIGALYAHEIDMLVTPDPLSRKGLTFKPVFDYEHVLVVARNHRLAKKPAIRPQDLAGQTLLTYPVEVERLDIYSHFLLPAGRMPNRRKVIETTDIMLKLVESGRGVAALPGWLVAEYADKLDIVTVRLGPEGIQKQIHLGVRKADAKIDYVSAFLKMAANPKPAVGERRDV